MRVRVRTIVLKFVFRCHEAFELVLQPLMKVRLHPGAIMTVFNFQFNSQVREVIETINLYIT